MRLYDLVLQPHKGVPLYPFCVSGSRAVRKVSKVPKVSKVSQVVSRDHELSCLQGITPGV